jgi:hypothetical protein
LFGNIWHARASVNGNKGNQASDLGVDHHSYTWTFMMSAWFLVPPSALSLCCYNLSPTLVLSQLPAKPTEPAMDQQ